MIALLQLNRQPCSEGWEGYLSLQSIHLRKLLKIMYLEGGARITALRQDIRDDIAREQGGEAGGGDFYGPFWRDAKDHVFGITDLRDQTRIRIEANPGRANLYPRLRDGFLLWWDRRRRWTNRPFVPAEGIKNATRLHGIDAAVKFENILSVRDGNDEDHFVYPYWFPDPEVSEEMGRLVLWSLCQAFPAVDPRELRALDVIRGQTFSLDRNPLRGDEAEVFARRFDLALRQWNALRAQYGG